MMAAVKKHNIRKRAAKRDPKITSYIMSRIRSKDTSIELRLRRALWNAGYHYRKNYRGVVGIPDIAFPGKKVAIFADSSFWHGRDWQARKPRMRTNRKYWVRKIERNMERDREVDRQLRNAGWIVLRYWDIEIENELQRCIEEITRVLSDRKA